MEKPTKQTVSYYDIDEVFRYLEETRKLKNTRKVMNHWVDNCGLDSNEFITISDWALIHEDGKFAYMVKAWYKPFLLAILDEFGEPDTECLTPGVRCCTLRK